MPRERPVAAQEAARHDGVRPERTVGEKVVDAALGDKVMPRPPRGRSVPGLPAHAGGPAPRPARPGLGAQSSTGPSDGVSRSGAPSFAS